MGYDAPCTLRVGGEATRGTAVLEQHELIFRGPSRLSIPLNTIASAVAQDGSLTVRFGRTRAVFEIGKAATRWAERITNPPSRLDKIGAKPTMTALVAGEKHADFVDELKARGVRVVRVSGDGVDMIFYGAPRRDALNRLGELKGLLKPTGALWVIRPKGKTTITEAEVMAAGKNAGLVDVKVVSFSASHTAEKFVIPRKDR